MDKVNGAGRGRISRNRPPSRCRQFLLYSSKPLPLQGLPDEWCGGCGQLTGKGKNRRYCCLDTTCMLYIESVDNAGYKSRTRSNASIRLIHPFIAPTRGFIPATLYSTHPETVFFPDIWGFLEILFPGYKRFAPRNHFFKAPAVKFCGRLDPEQKPSFSDRHYLTALIPGNRSGSEAPPSTCRWDGSPETTHDLQEVR